MLQPNHAETSVDHLYPDALDLENSRNLNLNQVPSVLWNLRRIWIRNITKHIARSGLVKLQHLRVYMFIEILLFSNCHLCNILIEGR
jgi:hypothetical protein